MTVMLQIYDKIRAPSLLAMAAAGGTVLALSANAQEACNLADGYADALVSYVSEVETCLGEADTFMAEKEDGVFAETNSARETAGLAPLNRRVSLNQAARAHALDMAERNYAGHSDLEGRSHIYRMRALDRQVLASATGANIVVLDAGTDPQGVYDTIRSDEANLANINREGFTDTGIGIAEGNGKLYVVQMLTTVDGELESPLPLQIARTTSFTPNVNEDMFRTAGWNLTDAAGNRLAGGKLMRMHADSIDFNDNAYLDVLVELDTDTYVLRGPMVSRQ